VRIFFDEDTGAGVPRALRALRLPGVIVEWARPDADAPVKKGTRDEVWIPWVASNNYLIFSCNRAIWETDAERDCLLANNGIAVFLTTGQERKLEMMRLVLNEWEWFVSVWDTPLRPVVWQITIRGAKKRLYPS
jgi:hypothetical protein